MKKIKPFHILSIGLGLTFLAASLSIFFNPDNFKETVEASAIFKPLLETIPFLGTLVGINDLLIGLLLISKFVPKIASRWATIWLMVVVLVIFSQGNTNAIIDGVEHAAPLAVALYLVLRNNNASSAE